MLISSHDVSVDAKGRVSIPAKFREYLSATYGEHFVLLTKDGCIFLYPLDVWKRKFSERLKGLSTTTKEVRQVLRKLYGRARACEFDRQGRILVPADMRTKCSIEKDAVVVGIEDKLEIWDKGRWEEEVDGASDGADAGQGAGDEEDFVDFEF